MDHVMQQRPHVATERRLAGEQLEVADGVGLGVIVGQRLVTEKTGPAST
jgi:hypothetical protein